jgi:Tfp pilus assembly protein PilN
VQVLSQAESLSTALLLEHLSKAMSAPVVIATGGDFALSRLLTAEQSVDPAAALLGGNANSDEFALQVLPAFGGKVHAAAIRVEFLHQVTALLDKHQSRLIAFLFHPLAFALALPAVGDKWMEGCHRVTAFGDTTWYRDGLLCLPDELTGRDYALHDERDLVLATEVTGVQLRAWAACAVVWSRALEGSGWARMAQQGKDHRQVSTLQRIAAVLSMAMLAGAVILFGLQWYGNRRKAELEKDYLVGMPVISALDSMGSQVSSRAELLESLGQSTLRPSGVSRLLDRVGGLVPEEVELTDLVWAPTVDELKKVEQDSASGYNLILRGASGDSWPVSKFSKRLEESGWVERVHVHGSEMNFRTGNHEFTFLLRVKDAG